MRYPPGKLPELIDVYRREDYYLASVRLIRGADDRIFEIGISLPSYNALRRIFQSRPFARMSAQSQRYYFVPAYSKRDDPDRFIGTVRIEQGNDARNFEFEMPKALIANLLWFYEMDNLQKAQHLSSWVPANK